MSATRFLARPLETVYFGSPRYFLAGEAHHGSSVFPPTPFAFQGMIRTRLLEAARLEHSLDDWSGPARSEREALIGHPDSLPATWSIAAPLPARIVETEDGEQQLEPWLPTPRMLWRGAGLRRPARARPIEVPNDGLRSVPSTLLGRPDLEAPQMLGGFLSAAGMAWALSGNRDAPWDDAWWNEPHPPFVKTETRPGLAIQNGVAEEGLLYFIRALRFQEGAGLLGSFQGDLDARLSLDALTTGAVRAGKKGRPIALEPAPEFVPAWSRLIAGEHLRSHPTSEDSAFWLVATSPSFLKDPLRPTSVAFPDGVSLKWLGATLGPPQTIGGFRIADGTTRFNRAYVPAGSSWLFRVVGGTQEQREKTLLGLHDTQVLGPEEHRAMGFGHTLVGLAPEISGGAR